MLEVDAKYPGTVVPISHTPGSYGWRYSRGLLVISDHARSYRGPLPRPRPAPVLTAVLVPEIMEVRT